MRTITTILRRQYFFWHHDWRWNVFVPWIDRISSAFGTNSFLCSIEGQGASSVSNWQTLPNPLLHHGFDFPASSFAWRVLTIVDGNRDGHISHHALNSLSQNAPELKLVHQCLPNNAPCDHVRNHVYTCSTSKLSGDCGCFINWMHADCHIFIPDPTCSSLWKRYDQSNVAKM